MLPRVSIVIPTFHSAHTIGKCLASVRDQEYPAERIETIIVDNFSKDGVHRTARRFGARFYEKGPERSSQRNHGASNARGRYLLMLDSDMILSPTVVRDAVEKMERGGCSGLFIPETIRGRGFWIRMRNFERSFYDGTVVDAVRFFRRSDFLRIGGYDVTLWAAEDWDLDRRLRRCGPFASIRSGLYHHEGRFRLGTYVRKKAYYSGNFSRYFSKWGKAGITRLQFGGYYRYFGVFTEKGKWKKLISHPVLATAMYFSRFLVGAVFLISRIGASLPGRRDKEASP